MVMNGSERIKIKRSIITITKASGYPNKRQELVLNGSERIKRSIITIMKAFGYLDTNIMNEKDC